MKPATDIILLEKPLEQLLDIYMLADKDQLWGKF